MSTPVDNNPQAGAGRPLPKKETDLFKNVVKHYEMKQYKKAIKQADTILKKFPNHGETLAMKGLTLNYMSRQDEAQELVKLGLRNDLRYVWKPLIASFVVCGIQTDSKLTHCSRPASQVACMLACPGPAASFGSKLQ